MRMDRRTKEQNTGKGTCRPHRPYVENGGKTRQPGRCSIAVEVWQYLLAAKQRKTFEPQVHGYKSRKWKLKAQRMFTGAVHCTLYTYVRKT